MTTAARRATKEAELERLRGELAAAQAREGELLVETGRLRGEQAATAEVLRVISESPTELQAVLDAIADRAARLCGTDHGVVALAEDGHILLVAGLNVDGVRHTLASPGARARLSRDISPSHRAILDRAVVHVHDLAAAPVEEFRAPMARALGARTYLAVPLLGGGTAVGVIALIRREVQPFTERQIDLVQTFAAQAVIAIENARLFSDLRQGNAALTEKTGQLAAALERQTATGEILRAIAASPGEARRVLDAVTASAARLCAGDTSTLRLADGGGFVEEGGEVAFVSAYAASPESPLLRLVGRRLRVSRTERAYIASRAMLDARTVHIADVRREEPASGSARAGEASLVIVPLLRDGRAIGCLSVSRAVQRAFSDQEIALLETFASQAVIALENARLFSELRERDERRRQELERASAIQQRLLPAAIEGWPGVLEVAYRFRPAVETSGDFYDVLRLTPAAEGDLPPLQIAVGDVAGKGMSAALVTALARSALRSSASVPTEMTTPAGTLRLACRRLHQDVGSGHFVACALAVLEPPGLHHAGPLLRLANAAQVPVLLVRGAAAREIEPPGYRLPLGAQPDGAYKDAEVELRAGDVVVFSSDGLVEAPAQPTAAAPSHLTPPENPGSLFGFARLAQSAAHWSHHAPTAEAVAQGIWSDLTSWCGDESHHDDVTLLVLRVPRTREPAP